MSSPSYLNRRNFVRTALTTLGALGMSETHAGLFGGLMEAKPPYPVTESKLLVGRQIGVQKIYWLDNDRALLPAHALVPLKTADGQDKITSTPLGIYIWDVKRNSYTRHADLYDTPRLFQYDHGEIAYKIDDPKDGHGTFVAMVGKMGEEKRLTLSGGFANHPELEPSKGPGWRQRSYESGVVDLIYVLPPQKGHIYVAHGEPGREVNAATQNYRVKLYRPGKAEPIELPILAKEWDAGAKFTYSEYLQKYVLVPATWRARDLANNNRSWPKDEPYPVYLISPDGKVETITIPPGYWYPSAAYPTREGLFWVSNNTEKNSRDAGGWLLKDGKVIKLFDQLVDGAGVSPDGCTIAYANNDFNPKTTEYVQAMELCAPEKNKEPDFLKTQSKK